MQTPQNQRTLFEIFRMLSRGNLSTKEGNMAFPGRASLLFFWVGFRQQQHQAKRNHTTCHKNNANQIKQNQIGTTQEKQGTKTEQTSWCGLLIVPPKHHPKAGCFSHFELVCPKGDNNNNKKQMSRNRIQCLPQEKLSSQRQADALKTTTKIIQRKLTSNWPKRCKKWRHLSKRP